MSSLIIYSSKNTPGINPRTGKPWADATGAFQPEALRCKKVWGTSNDCVVPMDCVTIPKGQRRVYLAHVFDHLSFRYGADSINTVGIFCHGWKNGIQLGYDRTGDRVLDFVRLLRSVCAKDVVVILYACSAADGDDDDTQEIGPATDGGFADKLRDMLCLEGMVYCKVYGHKTRGHATQNPHLVKFEGGGSRGDKQGGEWVIPPDHKLWGKWKTALSTPADNMRFTFHNKSRDRICADLLNMPWTELEEA